MATRNWVKSFHDGDANQRDLLGGKGANLAEMVKLGLPVPPGFIVTTDACRVYMASGKRVPEGLLDEVMVALTEVEAARHQRFGDAAMPLLLSVRSGAKFSMPGMMDTVLDLGINDRIVAGLATSVGEHFALDAHRRFLQMFGKVVLGVDEALFEQVLAAARRDAGAKDDRTLDPLSLRRVIQGFREIIAAAGQAVPDDPFEQLRRAIQAVFDS